MALTSGARWSDSAECPARHKTWGKLLTCPCFCQSTGGSSRESRWGGLIYEGHCSGKAPEVAVWTS